MADIVSYTLGDAAEKDTVPELYLDAFLAVSITENATLLRRSGRVIVITPDAARDVSADKLEEGRDHVLVNASTQYDLTLKNQAGTALVTLYPGCWARLVCDGSAWRVVGCDMVMPVTLPWNPNSTDAAMFVATRPWRVIQATARVEVAGTDGSAVTAVVKKVASGTAIGSGTAIHSGSVNLKGTAATNQALTVTPADAAISAGTAIGLDFTGTLTSAVGFVTLGLIPA